MAYARLAACSKILELTTMISGVKAGVSRMLTILWNGAEEVSFSAKAATIDGHGSFVRKLSSQVVRPRVTFRRLLWHGSKKPPLPILHLCSTGYKVGQPQPPAGASTFARPAKLQVPGACGTFQVGSGISARVDGMLLPFCPIWITFSSSRTSSRDRKS
jgi:hypothetical protein